MYTDSPAKSKIDAEQVREYLSKVAPRCQQCQQPKLFICTEKGCVSCDPICLGCDKYEHFLHRTNQIELLFTASHLKSHSVWLNQALNGFVSSVLIIQRESEELIKLHKLVVQGCELMLKDARAQRDATTHNWHADIMKNWSEYSPQQEASESAQCRFLDSIRSVNLHPQSEKNIVETTNRIIESWKKEGTQDFFYSLTRKIQSLFLRPPPLLEDLMKTTCLQYFIDSQQPEIFSDVSVRALRSMKVGTSYTYSKDELYQRLMVQDLLNHNRIYIVHDSTLELHTTCNLVSLPRGLRSLTFDTKANWHFLSRVDLNEFPGSLVCLRLGLFDRLARSESKDYSLDHLTNLKYLVILDAMLTPADQRKLMRFAINNKLEMLCLLNSKRTTPKWYDSQITSYRLQMHYQHYYPSIKEHCLVRRRKLLQVMLLSRSRLLQNGFFREQLLEASECLLDHKLQRLHCS